VPSTGLSVVLIGFALIVGGRLPPDDHRHHSCRTAIAGESAAIAVDRRAARGKVREADLPSVAFLRRFSRESGARRDPKNRGAAAEEGSPARRAREAEQRVSGEVREKNEEDAP
jgi:hypothetical protein